MAGICVTLKNKVLEEYLWNKYDNVNLEKFLHRKAGILDNKVVGNTQTEQWYMIRESYLLLGVQKIYLSLNFLMVPTYKKRVF